MQSEVFSVKKEAKSPAANKDGKEVLEVGGKKCEITQEIRKVKELGNIAGLPGNTTGSLVVRTKHFSDKALSV